MKSLRHALAAVLAVGAFALAQASAAATQTAIFAGGCFWSMQHGMEDVPGVMKVVAGYTGGHVAHPTYDEVTTETTGHYESVLVTYDPAKISYAQLVYRYFHLTDPTDGNGQFCDQGPSYHPAIFVADPVQRAAAQGQKARIAAELKGRPIATAILPAQTFWPAEGYHQDYARRNVAAYTAYRIGCGRDAALAAVWRR
ncbi:MAG: peptide-methionine (S)-S-oxide reductase MsrA [Caulobacterales bacterium]